MGNPVETSQPGAEAAAEVAVPAGANEGGNAVNEPKQPVEESKKGT